MNSYCRTDSLGGAAGLRKADSFDSGIDTKTESTAVRSSLDDHDDVTVVTPTDETTPAAGGGALHSRQSTGCSSSTADTSKIVDGEQSIQTTDGVPMEQDDEPPSPPTILPLTDAEARYDRLARTFVERPDVDDDEEVEEPEASLCRTLVPPSHYKTATHYMNGLFDNVVRLIRSPDDENDRSASDYDNECVDGDVSTSEIKATLLGCVRSKIQVLEKEKRRLQQEINCLRQTSAKVSGVVRSKVSSKDFNKYTLYVDELGKVLRLLLMLAARRARADVTSRVAKTGSTDMTSPSDSDSQGDKRVDELVERFNDAVALKSGIDRRRAPLDGALRQTLSADELAEYQLVVDATCRAHLDLQWVDDRLQLAQRQLTGLMDNILDTNSATEC